MISFYTAGYLSLANISIKGYRFNACWWYSESFNSLPIAALCDVINNTTQRSMEIFPSKPRTRCSVAPQTTHRTCMYRIYRVCTYSFVFFMEMKRTLLKMSIKYLGTEEFVSVQLYSKR